jgi:ComF family protein
LDTPLTGVAVGAYYDGPVQEMILKLKFHRLRAAAEPAAQLILDSLPSWPIDTVTAVPVSPARRRERGYNQAELIARQVAAALELPFAPLLARSGTSHQLGLDRRSRLELVQGAFYAVGTYPGRRVLIVDDVITTGATLTECAEVLTRVGAAEVWGAAVARH